MTFFDATSTGGSRVAAGVVMSMVFFFDLFSFLISGVIFGLTEFSAGEIMILFL